MLEAVIVSRTLNVVSCVEELRLLRDNGYKVDFALSTAEQPACGLKQLKAESKVLDLAIITSLPDRVDVNTLRREIWSRWPYAIIFQFEEKPPKEIRGYQKIGRGVYLVQRADLGPCLRAITTGDTPAATP